MDTTRRPGRTSRAGGDRGAAAVELALLLPFLLLLVFGIIDFGRALHAQITLTQAAREGVRLAALEKPAGDVSTRVQDAATPLTGVSAATTGCPNGAEKATVVASYPFEFVTPVGSLAGIFGGGGFGDFTMTGEGVMRCGG
jgi:Flp pilus assembly protein TadG